MSIKKNANQGASKTNPAKTTKKQALNSKNLKVSTADVKLQKVLKYQYPNETMTKEEKKTFRRNARAARKRFDKVIGELNHSTEKGAAKELKTQVKEYNTWKLKTLTEA